MILSASNTSALLFGLLVIVTATVAHARDHKPTVSVSMYFVPEKEACAPDGYSQAEEANRRCETLLIKDLDQTAAIQQDLPPEQLRLGPDLLDSIDAFADDCSLSNPCTTTERRYSIILVFEVQDLPAMVGRDIKIRRVPPTESRIPTYEQSGTLSEGGRWLNHQRADVFLPSHRVRWILEIGNWSWELNTSR